MNPLSLNRAFEPVAVTQNKGPNVGMRHMQIFLLFCNMIATYICRFNIGTSVVAMTDPDIINPNFPLFDWGEREIELILASFYWGYIFTLFPGGGICKFFGSKLTLGVATIGSSILSAITPFCVIRGGWQVYCIIRMGQGLLQGIVMPSIYQHLANWSPVAERSRLGAVSHTGTDIGNMLTIIATGTIGDGPLGWPGISYLEAVIGFVWYIVWLIFAADNPTSSRFITEAEKNYIETSLKHEENFRNVKIPIPWRAMCTSIPVLAIVVARCAENWGVTLLELHLPLYMHGVMHMDLRASAYFPALPFILKIITAALLIISADMLQSRKMMTVWGIRRTYNTIAFWIPAISLIAIGFMEEDQETVVDTLLLLIMCSHGAATLGHLINVVDLSANHAGVLMGVINTIANIMPMIAPLILDAILTTEDSRPEWQIVFTLTGIFFFLGNLFYMIFGSATVQPWDAEDFLKKEDNRHTEYQLHMENTTAKETA